MAGDTKRSLADNDGAGLQRYGVGLTTTGASFGPNASSQATCIWVGASSAYAGISPSGEQVQGQDAWYHVRMLLPSASYQPTTGQWNWLVEWHDDNHTAASGVDPVSMALGIYTDYPVVNGGVGQNPHLVLRLAGGSSASPTYQSIELPDLVTDDHWYDLTFHFVWSADPNAGLVEWYVDGSQVLSEHFPTLFTNPDGTVSYNTFGVYNYHLAAPWNSTVDFDDLAIGPTQASVGS